ncbi:glycoside hydrolase domain-containing protein [Streptomyces griseoaurantiacus]|uniref:glycoside hydrolase domain-containing protein n=1 Tax=Streptomyces griseoaurantiacus TaxID=68213 RepID=UPI0036A82587
MRTIPEPPSPRSPFPRTRSAARRTVRTLAALTATVAALGATAVPDGAEDGSTRISYRGHTFTVPADWQVVDLEQDPTACVRFDRHAVYLGTPGEHQDCPARVLGRTEALLLQPVESSERSLTENSTSRTYRATDERIEVTAAYGQDRAAIRRILDGAGLSAGAARAEASAAAPAPLPADATSYRGRGFDACTAPSQSSMDAWMDDSSYNAVGIYIGGVNRGCSQARLTAQWVRNQYANGWRFLPFYVGPQPASGSCGSACTALTSPTAQGTAAADDAVRQAAALGLGKGTVLYNDIEAYPRSTAVTTQVLTYLKAWTERLHTLGYRSGAYGSTASLVTDLVAHASSTTLPDVLHFAHWNDQANTTDAALPAHLWAAHQRVHQYAGNRTETHGGVTINIDRNQLDVGPFDDQP